MVYAPILMSALESIIIVVPALLAVAYVTVAERKTMASMQRRLGPNIVGYYGSLQAFADALKLLLKEYVSPTQANMVLFFLGPIITLIFSLLGYAVIPYGPGLSILDINLGIFFMLAVSSIATYGILLAGWSANSKYAFLGSLRSTAQLISYELILSSAILLVIFLTSNLNLTVNIESQKAIWFIIPLLPIAIIFFIGAVAETNRAPFDLAEAESELVSGFMTEHSAVIFVFFFLAEYASIVLICILTTILFIGGYNFGSENLLNFIDVFSDILISISSPFFYILKWLLDMSSYNYQDNYGIVTNLWYDDSNSDNYIITNYHITNVLYSLTLGVKTCLYIFLFIWVRASFPRIRFDQLMTDCWTIILPIVFAFVIFIPCIMWVFNIIPNSVLFC